MAKTKETKAEKEEIPIQSPVHQPAAGKRTGKKFLVFICIILFLFSVLSSALVGVLLFLPSMVENKVNQILTDLSAGDHISSQVHSIGLFQTNIACSIYRDSEKNTKQNVAAIKSLSIRYSPWELLHGKIKEVNIENADLLAEYRDGSFVIPALDIITQTFIKPKNSQKHTESEIPEDLNQLIPLIAEQIKVSGNLVLNVDNDIIFIYYQAFLQPDHQTEALKWNHIDYQLDIVNQSNRIRFSGDYWHPERKIDLKAELDLFSQTMPAAFRQKLLKNMRANADIDISGTYFWDSGRLQELLLDGSFELFYMPDKKIKIHCKPVIQLSYQQEQFRGKISGFSAEMADIPVAVKQITTRQDLASAKNIDGNIALQIGKEKTFDLSLDYHWTLEDFSNWHLTLKSTESSNKKVQEFLWDNILIQSDPAVIQSVVRNTAGKISLDVRTAFPGFNGTAAGTTVKIPELQITAAGDLSQKVDLTLQ